MPAQTKTIRVRTAKRKGKKRVWKARKVKVHSPPRPKTEEQSEADKAE